jgi:CRP-like cAMP-binding protein
MAHDRVDGDELPLTHEFLGMMLGTPRPGVTLAVQALEKDGLIAAKRRNITILDRKKLEKRANGAYVPPEG